MWPLQDHTADQWLTAFQETGTEIMGMPADDLAKLQNENPAEFEKVMMVRSAFKHVRIAAIDMRGLAPVSKRALVWLGCTF